MFGCVVVIACWLSFGFLGLWGWVGLAVSGCFIVLFWFVFFVVWLFVWVVLVCV